MPDFLSRQKVSFNELGKTDLIVDALYSGGGSGNFADDPISKILSTGNQGGFRVLGNERNGYKLVALYSLLNDLNWPDFIDYENGLVTYYGDNKTPGKDLHNTEKGGNKFFQLIFDYLHSGQLEKIPPIFLFTKVNKSRDVVFKGVLVPGAESVSETEDLVAVWKLKDTLRFQNYRAVFSILNIPVVRREWIKDIKIGKSASIHAPIAWNKWLEKKVYNTLKAQPATTIRTREQQLPQEGNSQNILSLIRTNYKNDYYGFEKCAAEIVALMDKNVSNYDLTRKTVDGGMDAVGTYNIGLTQNSIKVEFAIEAKCYSENNPVGVKDVARLIARLRHRQFGVLVTTSYIGKQAYNEISVDQHPVILIAGNDLVEILKKSGYDTPSKVSLWVQSLN